MKKTILFIIAAASLNSLINAQPSPLYIFIEDNMGRKDTVIFGLRGDATLGIDSALGEKNIHGVPYDSLEIRAIQRDSGEYHCMRTLHGGQPIYAPENTDSKIDFRQDMTGGPFPFSSIYFNFEFLIKGYEYPITVSGNFEELGF